MLLIPNSTKIGTDIWLHGGHSYVKRGATASNGTIYMRCRVRRCRACARLSPNGDFHPADRHICK